MKRTVFRGVSAINVIIQNRKSRVNIRLQKSVVAHSFKIGNLINLNILTRADKYRNRVVREAAKILKYSDDFNREVTGNIFKILKTTNDAFRKQTSHRKRA